MIYNKEISQVTLWLLNAEFETIHIEGQTIRATRPWINGKGYQREDILVEGNSITILADDREGYRSIPMEDAEEYIRDIL